VGVEREPMLLEGLLEGEVGQVFTVVNRYFDLEVDLRLDVGKEESQFIDLGGHSEVKVEDVLLFLADFHYLGGDWPTDGD